MILPIKPMTSSVWFNLATPQATRMLFPRDAGGSAINSAKGTGSSSTASVRQFSRSSGGSMDSMGPDPRQLRVSLGQRLLELLLADVLGRVERLPRTKTCGDWDGKVCLDTIEILFWQSAG